MIHLRQVIFSVLGFMVVLHTWAQDSGHERSYYIDLKLSDMSFDEDEKHFISLLQNKFGVDKTFEGFRLGEQGLGFTLTEGLQFSPNLGAEISAIYYGDLDIFATDSDGLEHHLAHELFGAKMEPTLRYPLLPWLFTYAKLGVSYWHAKTVWKNAPKVGGDDDTDSDEIVDNRKDQGFEISGGLGLRAEFNALNVILSYEVTKVDEMDVSSASIGFGFRY